MQNFILEMLFPANILASTEETESNGTKSKNTKGPMLTTQPGLNKKQTNKT